MKNLLLAAIAAVTVGASMPIAHAGNGISFGIAVGEQYPGYDEYPREFPRTRPDWEDEDQDRLSCREGRRIVREEGYRRIEPVKCDGNTYRYRAVRQGNVWSVRVDAWSGEIVSERIISYN